MTDEQRLQMLDFGALRYTPEEIAAIWGCDASEIDLSKGEQKQLYDKGAALSKYKIDMKLLEMAQNGDQKAIGALSRKK